MAHVVGLVKIPQHLQLLDPVVVVAQVCVAVVVLAQAPVHVLAQAPVHVDVAAL